MNDFEYQPGNPEELQHAAALLLTKLSPLYQKSRT